MPRCGTTLRRDRSHGGPRPCLPTHSISAHHYHFSAPLVTTLTSGEAIRLASSWPGSGPMEEPAPVGGGATQSHVTVIYGRYFLGKAQEFISRRQAVCKHRAPGSVCVGCSIHWGSCATQREEWQEPWGETRSLASPKWWALASFISLMKLGLDQLGT